MGTPSKGRRWVKAARYAIYGAVILGGLLVIAALYLTELLDTPAVRAQIQRILSEAVSGEVSWESLRIRILPAPHGVLRKARLEIPQVASVSAEEATADLRLWPLLRGRAEITSVTVTRPVIRISIVPVPAVEGKPQEREQPSDAFSLYRSAMGPIADGVQRFAPDTLFVLEDAELEVRVPDAPPMRLSKLWLQARAGAGRMELDATATSEYWSQITLSGRVEYADLSAKASLHATNIKPRAWIERYLAKVPVGVSVGTVRLRAEARTDAKTSLDCEIEAATDSVGIAYAGERVHVPDVRVKGSARIGAQEILISVNEVRLGGSRIEAGELRYSVKDNAVSGYSGFDLDMAQGMDYTRRLVPAPVREMLASFQPVTGRAHGRVKFAVGPPGWSVGVDIRKSDVAVQVRDLPGPVRLGGGAIEIDRHRVKLHRVALSLPAGKVQLSTLQYVFRNGSAEGHASIDLDVAQSLELARRALPQKNREALAVIETAAGHVEGNVKFAFGRGDWKIGLDVAKSDAALGVRQLPGPVKIARWSVEAHPASVTIDRAAVSLLDASAVASVTLDDFKAGPRARGSITEGTIGAKFLAWVWQLAKLPDRYEPAAPIRVAASRISRSPNGALEVQATAQFDAGPAVAIDLGWAAGVLDIRRATIKDGRSDAELALLVKGKVLEGRYAGSLSGSTIAAVLKRAKMPSGAVSGNLSFIFDREEHHRMTADGHLKGEALDLASLIGMPVTIERLDLTADGTVLHLHEATVNVSGQRVTKRGQIRRSASGLVIDAQLDSPGINLDALFPAKKETAAEAGSKPAASSEDAPSWLWPLPVTGRIAVRSDFIQRGRYKIAPVAGTLVLEERRAHLDLEQVQLCGISMPQTFEVTPRGYAASVRLAAQKQQLETTAHCLSGEQVAISGLFDLKADISTQGTLAELPKNLTGTVRANLRDGKVMKFALLGNILSMTNVASLMKEGAPKLDAEGFPYRTLVVAGHFENGEFIVEEGSFRSDALGLAANGWISILDYSSRLTVLVAPFSRLDELMRDVPIVGYIIGGALTSVPVGVSGDIRNPLVVPLGPRAVGSEVLGIFERTLKLPAKLVTPEDVK